MTIQPPAFFSAHLAQTDPEVFAAMTGELTRQQNQIELIASENLASMAVFEAQGSVMTNKYAEGYPGQRYYGGCEFVDDVEKLARTRLKELFGAQFANVQPHSGSQANQSVFFALLEPGDTFMGMGLDQGGHLTHGSSVNLSGKLYHAVSYGTDPETGLIDYDAVEALALKTKPKLIIAGATVYSRQIDFARFRQIADKVGAYLMADIAHIAGLVAAGLHPNPVPHAHVVTTTTHKTLRGPRGGVVMTNDKAIAGKIKSTIFPGMQGGPLMHVIAAKAVAFGEALQPAFKTYQQQVITNAQALAEQLLKNGLKIVSGGTDNHLLLLDLSPLGLSGKDAEHYLEQCGMTCNKNTVPNDPLPPTVGSGLRLGSPAATTRGFKAAEFRQVADWIAQALESLQKNPAGDAQLAAKLRAEVADLCRHYPIYQTPTS